MWSDVKDRNEKLIVTNTVGGREGGTIKEDFQIASVGGLLGKGL